MSSLNRSMAEERDNWTTRCGRSLVNINNNRKNSSDLVDWQNLPLVTLYNIFSYLSPGDRLKASSTCTSWRSMLYHSALWPQKHLKVNLCPHKFSIQNQKQEQTGYNTFKLQDTLIYKHHFGVCWVPIRRTNDYNSYKRASGSHRSAQNRKNFNEQLKVLIVKCSRFLTGITIYFDPNSSYNVLDLIKIVKHLSENEVPNYELNDSLSNEHVNCRNLKYFSIVPVTTLVRCASDQRFMSLYSGLTEAIRFLLSKSPSLEHVSLGDLHELVYSADLFCRQMVDRGLNRSLRCLHLSSIKGDIFRYMPIHASLARSLVSFHQLEYLSLDFDVFTTELVVSLSKLSQLKTLSINVHRNNRRHPGISNEAYLQLSHVLPDLEVSVNLLHTQSNHIEVVLDSLLNTPLSIRHFRAYYLEFKHDQAQQLLCTILNTLSLVHSNTLESVVLIDGLAMPKNYLKSVTPNVLVMLTWRCRKLRNLTIIGYEITDLDIIAMARLRGESLRNFCFPASCIQLTQNFSKFGNGFKGYYAYFESAAIWVQRGFKDTVSMPLKRSWEPIGSHQVPDIVSTASVLPQLTYQRTIVEQTCQCHHQ